MKFTTAIFILIAFTVPTSALSATFRCEKMFEKKNQLQIPSDFACNTQAAHGDNLRLLFNTNKPLFAKKLLTLVKLDNNIGGIQLNGSNKILLRSAILTYSPQCLFQIKQQYHIDNIVNLYYGQLVDLSKQIEQEKKLFKKSGGDQYINILNFSYKTQEYKSRAEMNTHIAKITNTVLSLPGNTLIHCLIGSHRTGIIFGVIQKCVNHAPLNEIIDNYKCHVGWKSNAHPGAYHQENIDVIKEFPCDLINN